MSGRQSPALDVRFWPEAEVGRLRKYQWPPLQWPGSINKESLVNSFRHKGESRPGPARSPDAPLTRASTCARSFAWLGVAFVRCPSNGLAVGTMIQTLKAEQLRYQVFEPREFVRWIAD